MRIAAFDLSLNATGYAIAVDGSLTESGVIPGVGSDVPRMVAIRGAVVQKVQGNSPDLVVIEDIPYSTNQAYAKENAGLAYMVRAALLSRTFRYALVAPTSLKKFIVGRGGSKNRPVGKELVIKEIYRGFGADVEDNNVADAIGLAYLGMAAVGDWQPRTDAQREVLTTVFQNNPVLRKMQREKEQAVRA